MVSLHPLLSIVIYVLLNVVERLFSINIMVAHVYGHAYAVTWECRTLDCHDADHAAFLCPVLQPGTCYQQLSKTSAHHGLVE